MRVAAAVALLGSLAIAPLHADPVVWEETDLGATAIVPMENAPFPHESRKDGYTYKDKLQPRDPHYIDNSVALFIPAGYTPGDRTHLLFYYHGWGNSIAGSLEQFKLREMVAASGRNVILVFPEGPKDASDSGLGKLEDEGGLARLAEETMTVLRRAGRVPETSVLGDVVLSGHSGAYRGIAFCLDRGGLDEHITEVYLLDAAYANLDFIAAWVGRHRETARLRSIFTEHLGGDNAWLMAALDKEGIPYRVRMDSDVTDDLLAQHRNLFAYTTTLDHNGTVKTLEMFLRTSKLPAR